MNLIIEQGNSSTKVAVAKNDSIVETFVYKPLHISDVDTLLEKYPFTHGILSTVIEKDEELIAYLRKKLPYFIFLDEFVPLPVKIPESMLPTLGKDRLAAIAAAIYLQPGRNLLVIDAGTAITYEFITAAGVYLGGNISPGMTTRFRALNQFTSKLPLAKECEEVPFIGTTTDTALQAGVINGIIYEMEGYINEWKSQYSDLFVFLTGGHSFYFERRLKNSIFADINLVLTGLNRILQYNVEN